MDELFDKRSLFDDRRLRDERRADDRRESETPVDFPDRRASDDRRAGSRRQPHPLAEDYDAAVEIAKAALIAHGMESAEFAAAQKVTSELHRRMHEDDGEL